MSINIRGGLALTIGITLGFSLSLGAGVLADRSNDEAPDALSGLPWEDARLLAEVYERVRRDYVDRVDDQALIEGAIRGMVAELDPHSAFLDSEEFREIRISTRGNYSGVGLEVNLDDGKVTVVSPIDDTPAFRAGVEPGDVIVTVDDEPVDSEDLSDTVSRMRGAPGSSVRLTVRREGAEDLVHFELERERIALSSVRAELLEPDFGYLRISQFSETTASDLHTAMKDLRETNKGGLRGLVLDLRNNPGGVLDAAVDVSDAFLESGLIVSASGRIDDSRFAMEAHPGDITQGAEIVVLVNAGSASASEIVAGALKDHTRAVIMGDVTFGKGSVQTVMPLSNGRAIKLTTSRYFTPSGVSIHETGIKPDILVRRSDGGDDFHAESASALVSADYQVFQALSHLQGKKVAQSSTP